MHRHKNRRIHTQRGQCTADSDIYKRKKKYKNKKNDI